MKEVLCKSILNRCGLVGIDYSLNPYIGCQHSCVYCYARYMKRYTNHTERWGEFVDVKVNAPKILTKELSRKPRGIVYLSTVTDPYQPLERKYFLTRRCLSRLLSRQFPVRVLTKSSLVLRDVDILGKFENLEVGFTITTTHPELSRLLEPYASPVEERLSALKELKALGMDTYVFLGPVIPYLTDKDSILEKTVRDIAAVKPVYVMVDRLNLRSGVWSNIRRFLEGNDPKLIPLYENLLPSIDSYFEDFKPRIKRLCALEGLDCEFCY